MDENTFSNDVFDDYFDFARMDQQEIVTWKDPNSLLRGPQSFRQSPEFEARAVDNVVVQQMQNTSQINQSTYAEYSLNTILEEDLYSQATYENGNLPVNTFHDGGLSFEQCYPSEQEPLSPAWLFGNTGPTVVDTPVIFLPPNEGIPCELPSKKTPEPPSNDPIDFDRNDWPIFDENGRQRKPLLHEFLRILLANAKYSHIAQYIDKRRGIFRFNNREKAAQLWALVKGRNGSSKMSYEKLARALRMYYSTKVISRTPGRYTFRFDSGSGFGVTWIPT